MSAHAELWCCVTFRALQPDMQALRHVLVCTTWVLFSGRRRSRHTLNPWDVIEKSSMWTELASVRLIYKLQVS